MVILGQDSTMYECRVLYIGTAPPVDTLKGIDAIQGPLQQRYPANLLDVNGIDAVISVHPTHLEVKYLESPKVVQFPLEKLSICAGVRAVNVIDGSTGDTIRRFVPVNTVQQESSHPAIFAAVIRRSQGRQFAECHMFICNSTRDALHLVNASATANMAYKKHRSRMIDSQRVEATSQKNEVIVVRTDVVNGYAHGGDMANDVQVAQSYGRSEPNTVRIDSGVQQAESKHFQIQQAKVDTPAPETIYITFDKSNLVPTGDDTLQVQHTARESRKTEEYREPIYVESPRSAPALRPVQVPYAQYPGPRLRPVAPPPPPPQPMMVQRPFLIRPPPPQMMVGPPPPQRLYTKRMVGPPPQPRFVAPPPVYVRSRARSASPVGHSNVEAFQPKWQGASRPKSDMAAPRLSRYDHHTIPPPQSSLEFFQQSGDPRAMYMNERAFSHRMHADNRIVRDHPAYHYPTAYELHDAMYYDQPTTKSNPKYSSSSESSSDIGRDNRFRRSRR